MRLTGGNYTNRIIGEELGTFTDGCKAIHPDSQYPPLQQPPTAPEFAYNGTVYSDDIGVPSQWVAWYRYNYPNASPCDRFGTQRMKIRKCDGSGYEYYCESTVGNTSYPLNTYPSIRGAAYRAGVFVYGGN